MDLKKFVVQLMPGPIVKIFAGPYVAGASIEEAIRTARQFWETRRVCSTIDLLGEELERDEDVQYTVDVYERLIDSLGEQPFATVSLKPTQLGSHRGGAHCQKIVEALVSRAAKLNLEVTLDMEDHSFTDMTLEIYRNLKKDHSNFGTVLQSRLFRTRDDILSLKGLAARIRMCIGIYNEPASVALQSKPEMNKALLEDIELLFKEGHYPEIATHDERVVTEALNIADRLNMKKDQYEVQMLMGVPRQDFQDELVRNGITVRLYVPFAEQWGYAISYCKRRLAANPMMAAYVMKNLASSATGKK